MNFESYFTYVQFIYNTLLTYNVNVQLVFGLIQLYYSKNHVKCVLTLSGNIQATL